MSIEVYRAHLDGLDLSEAQKDQLIESLIAICENIIEDSFKYRGVNNDEGV